MIGTVAYSSTYSLSKEVYKPWRTHRVSLYRSIIVFISLEVESSVLAISYFAKKVILIWDIPALISLDAVKQKITEFRIETILNQFEIHKS